MIKTAQWVCGNCRFASMDPVARACKEMGMPVESVMSLVIASMNDEEMTRADQKLAATFVRKLTHYVHPEAISAILKSWKPVPDQSEQAYESRLKTADGFPKDTNAPVEKALRDSGLSLNEVRRAVKEQWGAEVPRSQATTIATRFTHYLRRYTSTEAALNIVKRLAAEPDDSPEEYVRQYDKWSNENSYRKPGDNDHFIIKANCGHTIAQCRCPAFLASDRSKYAAPIPCPDCWAKQTGRPNPFNP